MATSRLLRPATLDNRRPEQPLDVPQVGHLLVNFREPVGDQSLDNAARRPPSILRADQRPNIVQREANRLSRTNESQAMERSRPIEAVVSLAAVLGLKKTDAFVVPHRADRDAHFPGELADREPGFVGADLNDGGQIGVPLDLELKFNLDNRTAENACPTFARKPADA